MITNLAFCYKLLPGRGEGLMFKPLEELKTRIYVLNSWLTVFFFIIQ